MAGIPNMMLVTSWQKPSCFQQPWCILVYIDKVKNNVFNILNICNHNKHILLIYILWLKLYEMLKIQ